MTNATKIETVQQESGSDVQYPEAVTNVYRPDTKEPLLQGPYS
jgi:hypothetical protein